MPAQSWTLLDHEDNLEADDGAHWDAAQTGGVGTARVRQWKAGRSRGVMSVALDSGAIRVEVLPTRGMGLWRAVCGEQTLGWKSPVRGPVHPSWVPLGEPSGLGWLDGFDELLVRCGLESNGAPEFDGDGRLKYPLHGRIANQPACRVRLLADPDQGTLSLVGEVEESRFHFLKLRLTSTVTLRRGEPRIEIHDRVENLSDSAAEAQLLYHVNFGPPLLDAGARFVAPCESVEPRNDRAAEGMAAWDRFAAPAAGYEEQVYFLKLKADARQRSQATLRNAEGTSGVSLQFSVGQLPCFTLWKNTTSERDGCVTGLEPGTNYPNPRSVEREHGRVLQLPPRGSQSFDLSIVCHRTAAEVAEAERAIAALA